MKQLQESDSEAELDETYKESTEELDMDSAGFMDTKPAARISGSISTIDEASGRCKPNINHQVAKLNVTQYQSHAT